MRKKIVLYSAFLAAACFTYTSCNKVSSLIKAITVDWTTTEIDFDIPIVSTTSALDTAGGGSFTYNLDSLIRDKSANQFNLSSVDHIYLTSCSVTILNPNATNNISNFENANVTLSTSSNPTVTNLGSVSIPDVEASSVNIVVDPNADLKSYVGTSGTTTFHYTVYAKARRVTTQVMQARVHAEYSVHVAP